MLNIEKLTNVLYMTFLSVSLLVSLAKTELDKANDFVNTVEVCEETSVLSESNEEYSSSAMAEARQLSIADSKRKEIEKSIALEYLENLGIPTPPENIKQYCISAGTEYGIQPELLMAITWTESNYDPSVSNGNCVGLCQVNRILHKGVLNSDLYAEKNNIYTAAEYLYGLFTDYEDPTVVLNMYGGYGYREQPSSYSTKVLELSRTFEKVDLK